MFFYCKQMFKTFNNLKTILIGIFNCLCGFSPLIPPPYLGLYTNQLSNKPFNI